MVILSNMQDIWRKHQMKSKNIFQFNIKCLNKELSKAVLEYRLDPQLKVRGSKEFPILVRGEWRSANTATVITDCDNYAKNFLQSSYDGLQKGEQKSAFLYGFSDGYLLEAMLDNSQFWKKIVVA